MIRSKDEEIEKIRNELKKKELENQYLQNEVDILNKEAEEDRNQLNLVNKLRDYSPSPDKNQRQEQNLRVVPQ